MSVFTKTVNDTEKGYAFTFDMDSIGGNFNSQMKKTTSRDGVELSVDTISINTNFNGIVQTEDQVVSLEAQDPRVRAFAEYLLEKATEKYSFTATSTAKTTKATSA